MSLWAEMNYNVTGDNLGNVGTIPSAHCSGDNLLTSKLKLRTTGWWTQSSLSSSLLLRNPLKNSHLFELRIYSHSQNTSSVLQSNSPHFIRSVCVFPSITSEQSCFELSSSFWEQTSSFCSHILITFTFSSSINHKNFNVQDYKPASTSPLLYDFWSIIRMEEDHKILEGCWKRRRLQDFWLNAQFLTNHLIQTFLQNWVFGFGFSEKLLR